MTIPNSVLLHQQREENTSILMNQINIVLIALVTSIDSVLSHDQNLTDSGNFSWSFSMNRNVHLTKDNLKIIRTPWIYQVGTLQKKSPHVTRDDILYNYIHISIASLRYADTYMCTKSLPLNVSISYTHTQKISGTPSLATFAFID